MRSRCNVFEKSSLANQQVHECASTVSAKLSLLARLLSCYQENTQVQYVNKRSVRVISSKDRQKCRGWNLPFLFKKFGYIPLSLLQQQIQEETLDTHMHHLINANIRPVMLSFFPSTKGLHGKVHLVLGECNYGFFIACVQTSPISFAGSRPC